MLHLAQMLLVAVLAFTSGLCLGLAFYRGEIGPTRPGPRRALRGRHSKAGDVTGYLVIASIGTIIAGALLGLLLLLITIFSVGIGRPIQWGLS